MLEPANSASPVAALAPTQTHVSLALTTQHLDQTESVNVTLATT